MNNLSATLSPQEWDVIANALALRPYVEVAALLDKLRTQLQAVSTLPEIQPELTGL